MSFEDYPVENRCRWWCEMNRWIKPGGFPFKCPEPRTREWGIMFSRLSQATPEKLRLQLWRRKYCRELYHRRSCSD